MGPALFAVSINVSVVLVVMWCDGGRSPLKQ